jgi:PAS domain S-box-containing protein
MKNYDEKTKRTLTVYVSIFFLTVMGIAVSGYLSYRNFEGEFRSQAERQLSAIAELKANGLADWRSERMGNAETMRQNTVLVALAQSFLQNANDVKAKTQLLSRLESVRLSYHYRRVFLLDVSGVERIASPDTSEPLDDHLIAEINPTLKSGKVAFLDFHQHKDGTIHLSILVPIYASQEMSQPLGILVLDIDPNTYLYPFLTQWPIFSDTAETLLVRRDGQDVLYLNKPRFAQNALLLRYPLTETSLPAVKAVLGQVGAVEGVDYRGQPVLADVRPVPDSPWFLVSKMDTTEVYAPLRSRLWQTLSLIGMAILTTGAGLLVAWRQQRLLFYRTQAEAAEALRASEEKFRMAFILSPDSININRLQDGMYVSVNNGFTKITGYPADEVIGKTSLELDIWADPRDRQRLVAGLKKTGEVINLEARFRAKNGDIIYGLMSASMLELNGAPHIINITRDITERKRAEDALRESEETLSTTLHSIGDGVISTDKAGLIVSMNPVAEKYCGCTLGSAKGQPLTKVFHIINSETRKTIADPVTKVIESGQTVGLANHTALISKDGIEYQIADSAAPIKNKDGVISGVVLVFSDVTEKYKATELLKESEQNFVDIFQTVSEGIAYTTLGGEVLSINKSMEQIFEIPKEQIVGKNILSLAKELLSANNIQKVLPVLFSLIQGRDVQPFEVEYKNKILELTTTINKASGRLTGVVRDITEHKRAEQARIMSEANLHALIDNRNESIWSLDNDYNLIVCNDYFRNSYFAAYQVELKVGLNLIDILSPELKAFWKPRYDAALAGQKVSFEFFATVQSSRFYFNVFLNPIFSDGKISGVSALSVDITERKQAEEDLRESEDKFKYIFDYSVVGKSITHLDGEVHVNNALCNLLGYSPQEMQSKKWQEITHPDDIALTQNSIEELLSGEKQSARFVKRFIHKNGSIVWVDLSSSIRRDPQNKPLYLMSAVIDITDRKLAEEALKDSEERLRLAVSAGRMGTWDRNFLSGQLDWSAECKTMFGLPPEIEMSDERFVQTLHPDDRVSTDLAISEALENHTDFKTEYRVIWPDGTLHWIGAQGRGYYTSDGKAVHMAGITFDITERKQAEESLRQSEEKYRNLFNNSEVGMFRTRLDGSEVLEFNKKYLEILGYSLEELKGVPSASLWADHRERERMVQLINAEGFMTDFECDMLNKQGEVRRCIMSQRLYRDSGILEGSIQDITERKQAEEALRESEERFHTLYDNATVGLYRTTPDGRILMLNPAGVQMLGFDSFDEIAQRNLENIGFDGIDSRSEFRKLLEREGVAIGLENKWTRKDGSIIFVRESAKAFRDGNGKILYYDGSFEDISARVQAEDALRESEALYRQAIEVANAVPYRQSYHVNDIATVYYDFIGEGIRQITGYDPEEFNEALWDSLTQERFLLGDLAEYSLDEAIERVRSGASPVWKCNHLIRARDGSLRWVFEAAVELRDASGISHGSIGMLQDITERKQAEDEILKLNAELEQRVRQRTAELEDLYNNAPCGYHSVDADSIFLRINDTELSWLGYEREEIIGKVKFSDLITPSDIEIFRQAFPAFKERGWVSDMKFDMLRKDGSILPVLLSATVVRDKEGRYLSSRSTIIDYTQQTLADKAMREWQAKLETANKELEAFSYSVSHDLRAPLRGIDGWSQALLEDYHDQLDEQGQQYIDRVRSETQRMGYLIDDMLQLSRLTRAEMTKQPVDLSALVQIIIERLKRDEPKRQVEFNIQAGITAEGDLNLLEAALTNLLANAFKFTSKRADARIEFGQTELQGQRVFFVRDNGAGFDMAYAQKLFGAFQRMHKVSEFPGTGVGLAIVQRVIHRHGGRVWAEAEVEHGATFYFTLEPSSPALPPLGKGDESRIF